MRIKGISTTKPSPLLRNSISIRTCADEASKAPGVIDADTVAHCGPTLNHSIRNNASKWIVEGIEELQQRFPFAMAIFDSDCGGEFINHGVAQTRSRSYQKNDQAHVESKNNHVVRKHAFYWALRHRRRTGAAQPAAAAGVATDRKRIYDKPATPWQCLQTSGVLDAQHLSVVSTRIDGINPADLTRQINTIQMQLLDLAKDKTDALAAARHIDLEALQPSINRLTKA